jgi:hypothetical protein
MLTRPSFSSGLQSRMSSGWGQSFSFPGPPPMTVQPSSDSQRESNITVQAAGIRLPEIPPISLSINSNPTYNSPYIDMSSNYGNPLNIALQNAYTLQSFMQDVTVFASGLAPCDLAQLCQRVTDLEDWRATGATACSGTTDIPVLEDWYYDPSVDTDNIQKMRFRLRIKDGLITLFNGSVDSPACAGGTLNGLEPVNTCPE